MLKDSRPAPVFAACLFALALVILIGLVPAFASEHNPSFPFSSTALVPSSSLGDFVLDNVIPYRSTHWKPAPANERWWPNTQQQGKLSGVAIIINGTRWIRAKATVIRWSQDSINWILANDGGNPSDRRVEVIFHAFKQDSNDCISGHTTDTSDWIQSNLPGAQQYAKPGCPPWNQTVNEARVVINRADLLVAKKRYYAVAWFVDDEPRDLGEIPLAYGWQNRNHGNEDDDDNVKKICFGADEGRSWGPNVFSGACKDAAPVTLFSAQNYGGSKEGFTGNDHWLPNNENIGNDNTRSIKVNAGWQVRLYTDSNYGPPEEIFNNDDNDLTNNAIGTGTSSVKAITNGVAVYRDHNFSGDVEVFNNCDDNLADNLIGENQITSVRVPPSWRLELYADSNGGGKKLVFQGIDDANIWDNKNFNDIASSLCVVTPQVQQAQGEVGDWTGTDD